jgi:hypothetical protein
MLWFTAGAAPLRVIILYTFRGTFLIIPVTGFACGNVLKTGGRKNAIVNGLETLFTSTLV